MYLNDEKHPILYYRCAICLSNYTQSQSLFIYGYSIFDIWYRKSRDKLSSRISRNPQSIQQDSSTYPPLWARYSLKCGNPYHPLMMPLTESLTIQVTLWWVHGVYWAHLSNSSHDCTDSILLTCLMLSLRVISNSFFSNTVVHSYQIEVTTGDVVGAGTDATITFILFSRSDAEGPFFVDGSGNAFDRNTTGTYYKDSSVYPIEKIR